MKRLAKVKSFLVSVASSILASAIFALFTIPDEQLHLSDFALGVISIPIFLALAAFSSGIYGIYLIIKLVDILLTKPLYTTKNQHLTDPP